MDRPTPNSLTMDRFRRLAQRTTEVWQGSVRKLPIWMDNPEDPDNPDAPPHRPVGVIWTSARTGLFHLELPEEGEAITPDLVLKGFVEFGLKLAKELGGRPGRVEVDDPQLRDALERALTLAELKTPVVLVKDLPGIKDALLDLEASAQDDVRDPGALETDGVTPERFAAFAAAAADFYRARPWRHLSNEDLIVVDAPSTPAELKHVCVLGEAGVHFGLSFFDSRREFEKAIGERPSAPDWQPERTLGVTFVPIDEMPFADLDAWDEHQFPLADPIAYPLPAELHMDGAMIRPEPSALTFMEALLRAIAQTTELELDAGRWQRTVDTFDGPKTLALSLPMLIEAEQLDAVRAAAPETSAAVALTPLERAQELADDAADAIGRRQIKLARQALAVSEDCVDAWVVLGETAGDAESALDWYQRGVDAGARALGAAAFAELKGEFWQDQSTRPYMRARLLLAETSWDLGQREAAYEHYQALLDLNPHDDQGVRYMLVIALLDGKQDHAVGELLARYPDDVQAIWPYARTLWRFRTEGDTPRARAALDEAIRVNPHVVKYLLKPESLPEHAPPETFSLGSRDEAAYAVDELIDAFEFTDGAIDWVRLHSRANNRHAGPRVHKKRGPSSPTGRTVH